MSSKKQDSTVKKAAAAVEITPEMVQAVLAEISDYEFEGSPIKGECVIEHLDCDGYSLAASQAARRALRRGVAWQSVLQVFLDLAAEVWRYCGAAPTDVTAKRLHLKAFTVAACGGSLDLTGVEVDDLLVEYERSDDMSDTPFVILLALARVAGFCLSAEQQHMDEEHRLHNMEVAMSHGVVKAVQEVCWRGDVRTALDKLNALCAAKPAAVSAPKPATNGAKRARQAA